MKTETSDETGMGNVWIWFLKMLQQQGLSFVLLGVAIWYLVGEIKHIEAKYEVCQATTIELYKAYYNEDKEVLVRVLNKLDKLEELPKYEKKR